MRLNEFDQRLDHLPRKAALVAATLLGAWAGVKALPYVWPFAAAFVLSKMLEPFVRFASKGFSRASGKTQKRRRMLATLFGMLLLFGLVGALAGALVSWLFRELAGFLKSLPQLFEWLNTHALPALLGVYQRYRVLLPDFVPKLLEDSFQSLGQSALRWAGSLSGWITSGAWSTAASIPNVLLSMVVTVMSTYYLTADRERIAAFFRRAFSGGILRRSRLIRANVVTALVGQVRSQLTVSLVVMFFLMIALGVAGVKYGVAIGMLIGIADALPVLGAGLFLIPWGIVCLLTGQTALGVTLLCLYVGAMLIRQVLEPKLVGRQLGLYPLATMSAMYVGYRLFGFLGLIGGPLMLSLARAVLDADRAFSASP